MRILVCGVPRRIRGRHLNARIKEYLETSLGKAASFIYIETCCPLRRQQKDGPLVFVINGRSRLVSKLSVASAIGDACAKLSNGPSTSDENRWWYHGFEIGHLLKK